MTAKTRKLKIPLIVLAIILVFVVAFYSAFLIIVKIGEAKLKKNLLSAESVKTFEDMGDDNEVYYNGKTYVYNENLLNILLLGIDKQDFKKKVQGQADAIYLLSIDLETNKANILAISRNTMTDNSVLSENGEVFGTEYEQICLAYSYGKDDESSSKNCVDAVSNLLYGLPINNYYTLHMKSIAELTDAVGGVEVTIPKDAPSYYFADKLGKKVVLRGDDTIKFLRMRAESNAPRLERHKEFIMSFLSAAKRKTTKDLSFPIKIYNKLLKEAVTNIDSSSAVFLASKASDLSFNILSISGKNGFDGQYETFEADETALKELVLNNFYKIK